MNHATCTVRGSIDRVYYSSPTFSAGRMRVDGGDWVSFAGNVFATEGDTVSLAGTWETGGGRLETGDRSLET